MEGLMCHHFLNPSGFLATFGLFIPSPGSFSAENKEEKGHFRVPRAPKPPFWLAYACKYAR